MTLLLALFVTMVPYISHVIAVIMVVSCSFAVFGATAYGQVSIRVRCLYGCF